MTELKHLDMTIIRDMDVETYDNETDTTCYYNPSHINSTAFVFSQLDSILAGTGSSVSFYYLL